ncbi:MAG: carboxypeptidase regulatory-like domain-containing protein [Candidatus Neomarinimicrobiota bacterium]
MAQGVTTAELSGIITASDGSPLPGANVVLVHEPSGTQYGAIGRESGNYDIINLKVGGPYSITVSYIGYGTLTQSEIYLNLGVGTDLHFTLSTEAIALEGVEVVGTVSDVLNADRTGAATTVSGGTVQMMPSIKRSTRDLTRLDPRSDGNFSFGGRNWLYNNISLDGSYFNNAFGLDDPAPGGQTAAEPVSFDAIEQVQVSIAPFDVREGGFTGAGINSVTKSGTNTLRGTAYSYLRNESLVGNKVGDDEVIADPSHSFNQTGISISGPIIQDKLFFFVNAEIERREDPGSDFVADDDGNVQFGESRVSVTTMNLIRDRMMDEYDYDTGPYQDYSNKISNNKFLAKIDWNMNSSHNLSFRFSMLDAQRDLGPHAFVLSFNNTGRGPNASSLPFRNSGYTINNDLQSYALEVNSIFGQNLTNRLFVSYNRFRDFRKPFSVDFPTVEIGDADGILTYTTLGHEPFSIHNILDQDVLQITNNVSYFMGKHVITGGVNYESFEFFNSFNIFRHGLFQNPPAWGGSTFGSLAEFFALTHPDSATQYDFDGMIGSGDFKGEIIEVAQFSLYAQDKLRLSSALTVTAGLRVDIPIYNTEPVANPFSTGLDIGSNSIDQAKLPDATPLFSPRVGFNYDATGDRSLQVRGGVGIFTGRVPFVWIGNVISNPGTNPNLWGAYNDIPVPGSHETDSGSGRDAAGRSILQQSFDLNGIDPDFKWPQVLTTNVAIDKKLPGDMLGTVEFLYGKDINAIVMKNYDLPPPVRYLADGRPYYSDATGDHEYTDGDFGAGIYVLENVSEGDNMTVTAQLQKEFSSALSASVAYTYLTSTNSLKSTEIASVLWQNQPVQGDPNDPKISPSEFGNPHRFITTGTYRHEWSSSMSTRIGLFFEVAQGNTYIYSGGNRYSFIYSGDVNGDGQGGNDLIYIPKDANDIVLDDPTDWAALDAFIEQDDYLSEHRGEIAERFGAINPWFSNLDLRILHDIKTPMVGGLQLSLDILNFGNLINSSWGVRKIASAAATSPLKLVEFDSNGEPSLDFDTSLTETYIDDPGPLSRWQIQIGLRYSF